ELALDLLDELADLCGGSFRLLALNADQRRLVLAIIEHDVEDAVGQQCDGNHCHEQGDIFSEQASPGFRRGRLGTGVLRPVSACGCSLSLRAAQLIKQFKTLLARTIPDSGAACPLRHQVTTSYSITSSARASNGSGMVRPRALAALRFMINSTVVDRWTGRSPGFSPLRIFPV